MTTSRLLIVTGASSFVSPTSYSAALDCRGVYDAVVAGGALSTVTSATAVFVSGDTGKTYYLATTTGTVTTGTLTYVSSTSATMSVAAGGAMTGARLIFGTNDTAAWQAALNAAAPGQIVAVDNASWRSLCTGNLTVPNGVRLGVLGLGPFDPQTNPAMNTWGPTFVVGQNATAFITLGTGSGLGDFIFYSANQVPPTATTATTFGAFVTMSAVSTAGCRIGSPYIANAYIGLDIQGGRHQIDRPQIGALNRGIRLDHSQDTIAIQRASFSPYWRICEGMAWTPSAASLDAYALNNCWGVEVNRSDSFWITELFAFGIYGGLLAIDSSDGTQSPKCGYGQVGMIDADDVAIGIAAYATGSPGILIHSAILGANGTGVGTAGSAGIATIAGGSLAPKVVLKSWSYRGSWSTAASSSAAGTLIVPATNPG